MKALRHLNPYIKRYRRMLIPGLLCSVIAAGFTLGVPMVVRQAIDAIPRMVALTTFFSGSFAEPILRDTFFWGLLAFGAIILGLSLMGGLFLFIMRQTVVVASRHIEYDLRNDLYEHLQKLSGRFFYDYSTGDVITRASSDIEHVRRYVGPALMYAARNFVIMVCALIVMIYISPRLTLYALLPMPLLTVAIFFGARAIHRRSEAIQRQYAVVTSRVQEAFAGVRVLKAYAREAYEAEVFEQESEIYRDRALDLARVDAALRPIFVVLIGLSILVVVWLGGLEVMKGTLTIGNIAEYIIYIAIMIWPVASIGMILNMMQRAAASTERIDEIMRTKPAIADGAQTQATLKNLQGALRLKGVGFQYETDGPAVLHDLNVDIPAGTTLAIVGRTGSGKTTLVELLPRLLEATEGRVEIDGHDVRTIPLNVLRAAIGYVPQDVFLFSDTVAENIRFGAMEAKQTAVEQAAYEAELLENINDFPKGFETFVGERGVTLSGGQKQRASIARALIRNPKILILDDALSAVDTKTEAAILGHLRKHYGQRTIVIVSHRISAVQSADLILVLDEGRVIERGTHTDLVEQNGLYADLYRKQLLEAEIEALA